MIDYKELVDSLNANPEKDQSAYDWADMLTKRTGYNAATPTSMGIKIGGWLRVMAHLGYVKATRIQVTEKKVRYTYKRAKDIPYVEI